MKVLALIGNGFDLGHGLPTKYDDFINSNYEIYASKYQVFQSKDNNWCDIESKYEDLLYRIMSKREFMYITEEADRIISDYGYNEYGDIDYYVTTSEAYRNECAEMMSYNKLLTQFEQEFSEYLKVKCNDEQMRGIKIVKRIKEILSSSTKIINFNYTHTVEMIYGIKNIVHIHGDINDKIEIGCGNTDYMKESVIDYQYPTIDDFEKNKDGMIDMMEYYEEDMEGSWVERRAFKDLFDQLCATTEKREKVIFALLDEKSKDEIVKRKQEIESLQEEHYDKVFVIGHSLGDADYEVFNAINKDAIFYCYYHTDNDFDRMKNILERLRIKFELIEDKELYKKE